MIPSGTNTPGLSVDDKGWGPEDTGESGSFTRVSSHLTSCRSFLRSHPYVKLVVFYSCFEFLHSSILKNKLNRCSSKIDYKKPRDLLIISSSLGVLFSL